MITLVDYQLWLECYRDYIGDPNAAAPALPEPGDQNGDGDVEVEGLRNSRKLPVQTGRERPGPVRER